MKIKLLALSSAFVFSVGCASIQKVDYVRMKCFEGKAKIAKENIKAKSPVYKIGDCFVFETSRGVFTKVCNQDCAIHTK